MIRRILDTLAVVAFVALMPLLAVAQSGVSPISASPGAKPGQGTKTTCSVAGGVWRTSDPAATLDCGAGLTYASGALSVSGATGTTVALTVSNGTSTGNILNVQDNGSNVFTVADGSRTVFSNQYGFGLGISPSNSGLNRFTVANSGATAQISIGDGFGSEGMWLMASTGALATYAPMYITGTNILIHPQGSGIFNVSPVGGITQFGSDLNGAPTNQIVQTSKGITGTDVSGPNLTIKAQGGTGASTGGTIAFQTAPVLASGTAQQTPVDRMTIPKTGGIQLVTASTKPTCDSAARGQLFYVAGGAGVADTYEVCRKDAGDAYAWVSIF